MFNLDNSDSYSNLSKRITQHVQQSEVKEQIVGIMRQAVEKELNQQKIVLSQPERIRLADQVTKAVLNDILAKMNGESAR